ncbi:ABC transporter ATP-binding protein [Enterovirga sp. CN4-39]|uniref:ABC transporter ATP-binding protein n=1 Tax=Enterovirga sp. CN4-39 TaxID=3400910 RepID=UPI003C08D6E9
MTSTSADPARHAGASVDVRSLTKAYDAVVALKAIDLSIAPGEFVALLGPSGCGKTTLLRCIAGLIAPSGGDVLVAGRDITALPVHRRGLGMVFQSYALFPHMTVGENVAFGLRMRGVPKADRAAAVAKALGLVHMEGLVERYPAQLSGGQQQRVALARSLVTSPSVLLLDEPFGALDAQLRDSMQIELRRMQRKLGITAVFVTHDQREAFTMADRVAVLSGGTLQQFDKPSAIYNRPATPFVAQFIGQVNRFAGTYAPTDSTGGAVTVAGLDEPLRAEGGGGDIPTGTPVIVMVRPERIRIATVGEGAAQNRLPGTVSDIIFSGEKVGIWVETPIGTVEVHQFSTTTDTGTTLAIGQAVTLRWDAQSTMVFMDE